jgi:cyanophycinase
MPAAVPPGHTRGAIIPIGTTQQPEQAGPTALLQRFWTEAGGYGARIVVCTIGDMTKHSHRYSAILTGMEVESIDQIEINNRNRANGTPDHEAIDRATGILLIAPTIGHMAANLGGTALATTIRRANAHGKTIAAIGASAPFLCQHVLAISHETKAANQLISTNHISFTPGLGLINRIIVAIEEPDQSNKAAYLPALIAAVATNPFLIGTLLQAETGLILYPDSSLEVFGRNNVLIIAGNQISYTDIPLNADQSPSIHGVQLHLLNHGQIYNYDTHQAQPEPPSEIPDEGPTEHVTF